METITKVQLHATLKCGGKVWEAGVYNAPVPPDLIAEARAKNRARSGVIMVEILETKVSKVVPIRSPEASTSVSSVTTSNLREGPMYAAEKKVEVPPSTKLRKKRAPKQKLKLVLRG